MKSIDLKSFLNKFCILIEINEVKIKWKQKTFPRFLGLVLGSDLQN